MAAAAAPLPETTILDVKKAETALPLPMLLKAAAEQSQRTLNQVMMEIARLAFGPGRISIEDYFALRLYQGPAMSLEEKRTFASPRTYKALAAEINYNEHWLVTTGHKLITEMVMRGFGFPIARTRVLYSTTARYPALQSLGSADDLKRYLATEAAYPLFCKPIGGSLSLGTLGIEAFEATSDQLKLTNGETIATDAFIADVVESYADGYLIQDRIRPHADVKALAGDRLPTVRLYTLNGPDGPKLFRAVWKIPAGRSMADNFWRGNILAALDYEAGAIKRAIMGSGLNEREIEAHPDTGARLIGVAVPGWTAMRDMVLKAAATLGEVPLIGWDIAPSEEGAVIVEANDRPDFRLVQMAERRGILDDELARHVAWAREVRKAIGESEGRALKVFRRQQRRRVVGGTAAA